MTQHDALYVQLEAKPGKEQEVANLLSNARSMVDDEPETSGVVRNQDGSRGPSAYLIRSRTNAVERRISMAGSRRN